jgi:hypothetical protein
MTFNRLDNPATGGAVGSAARGVGCGSMRGSTAGDVEISDRWEWPSCTAEPGRRVRGESAPGFASAIVLDFHFAMDANDPKIFGHALGVCVCVPDPEGTGIHDQEEMVPVVAIDHE